MMLGTLQPPSEWFHPADNDFRARLLVCPRGLTSGQPQAVVKVVRDERKECVADINDQNGSEQSSPICSRCSRRTRKSPTNAITARV